MRLFLPQHLHLRAAMSAADQARHGVVPYQSRPSSELHLRQGVTIARDIGRGENAAQQLSDNVRSTLPHLVSILRAAHPVPDHGAAQDYEINLALVALEGPSRRGDASLRQGILLDLVFMSNFGDNRLEGVQKHVNLNIGSRQRHKKIVYYDFDGYWCFRGARRHFEIFGCVTVTVQASHEEAETAWFIKQVHWAKNPNYGNRHGASSHTYLADYSKLDQLSEEFTCTRSDSNANRDLLTLTDFFVWLARNIISEAKRNASGPYRAP